MFPKLKVMLFCFGALYIHRLPVLRNTYRQTGHCTKASLGFRHKTNPNADGFQYRFLSLLLEMTFMYVLDENWEETKARIINWLQVRLLTTILAR